MTKNRVGWRNIQIFNANLILEILIISFMGVLRFLQLGGWNIFATRAVDVFRRIRGVRRRGWSNGPAGSGRRRTARCGKSMQDIRTRRYEDELVEVGGLRTGYVILQSDFTTFECGTFETDRRTVF